MRRSQVSLALAGLLLLGALGSPAFAAPRSGAPETAEQSGALPFTFADLGWLIAGFAALIVLLVTIQVLAHRPTPKLARTAIQQDPTSP